MSIEVGNQKNGDAVFIAVDDEAYDRCKTSLTGKRRHLIVIQQNDLSWLIEALKNELEMSDTTGPLKLKGDATEYPADNIPARRGGYTLADAQALEPGREKDAVVAEVCLGWVWRRYHDLDYTSPDGPLRRTLVAPDSDWLRPPDYVDCDLSDPRQAALEPHTSTVPRCTTTGDGMWLLIKRAKKVGLWAVFCGYFCRDLAPSQQLWRTVFWRLNPNIAANALLAAMWSRGGLLE